MGMMSVLVKVGWKKDFIEKSAPRLPISGWMGDNLLKKSANMGWWSGADVLCGKETIHVETLYDYLDKVARVPERPTSAPMRMPISGIYKIKGVGDVLVYKKDTTLGQTKEFDAQIQVLDIPGEIK